MFIGSIIKSDNVLHVTQQVRIGCVCLPVCLFSNVSYVGYMHVYRDRRKPVYSCLYNSRASLHIIVLRSRIVSASFSQKSYWTPHSYGWWVGPFYMHYHIDITHGMAFDETFGGTGWNTSVTLRQVNCKHGQSEQNRAGANHQSSKTLTKLICTCWCSVSFPPVEGMCINVILLTHMYTK